MHEMKGGKKDQKSLGMWPHMPTKNRDQFKTVIYLDLFLFLKLLSLIRVIL